MKIVKGGGRNGCFDVRLRVLRLEAVEVSYLPICSFRLQVYRAKLRGQDQSPGNIISTL